MTKTLNELQLILLVLAPIFLCWGSFLNVVAYRIIRGENIVWPRSHCPSCNTTISWYDNIPVISWLMLLGSCRHCTKPISFLYPFIELLTVAVMVPLVVTVLSAMFTSYFIFFSALIVTIRSDIETMLISRYMTIFLIPLGFMLSFMGLLQISLLHSMLGASFGYGFLYFFSVLTRSISGKEGIGEGDLELLAFIGSFTGIFGCWFSLMIGSVIGSLFGITYLMIMQKDRDTKIPFGPFLACGAIAYVFLQDSLINVVTNLN